MSRSPVLVASSIIIHEAIPCVAVLATPRSAPHGPPTDLPFPLVLMILGTKSAATCCHEGPEDGGQKDDVKGRNGSSSLMISMVDRVIRCKNSRNTLNTM